MYTIFVNRDLYYGCENNAMIVFNSEIVKIDNDKKNIPFYVFTKNFSAKSSFRIGSKKDFDYINKMLFKTIKCISDVLVFDNAYSLVKKYKYNDFIKNDDDIVDKDYFYVFANIKFSDKDIEQIKYMLNEKGSKYYGIISFTDGVLKLSSSTHIDHSNEFLADKCLSFIKCDYLSPLVCSNNSLSSISIYKEFLLFSKAELSPSVLFRYFSELGSYQEYDIKNNNAFVHIVSSNEMFSDDDFFDDFDCYCDESEYVYDYEDFEDDGYIVEYDYYYDDVEDIDNEIKIIENSLLSIDNIEKVMYLYILKMMNDNINNYILFRVNEYSTNYKVINNVIEMLKKNGFDACIVENKSIYILVEF